MIDAEARRHSAELLIARQFVRQTQLLLANIRIHDIATPAELEVIIRQLTSEQTRKAFDSFLLSPSFMDKLRSPLRPQNELSEPQSSSLSGLLKLAVSHKHSEKSNAIMARWYSGELKIRVFYGVKKDSDTISTLRSRPAASQPQVPGAPYNGLKYVVVRLAPPTLGSNDRPSPRGLLQKPTTALYRPAPYPGSSHSDCCVRNAESIFHCWVRCLNFHDSFSRC